MHWYTRCGFIGTSAKLVLRSSVFLRSRHSSAQALAVGQPAVGLHLFGHLDEQLERRLGVRHDAEVGREDAADLRRLDVDVHEGAALGVDLDRAGVAVGPAVADAQHEVAGQHGRVAVAVAGLQAAHAGHQRMVVGDRAPAHQRRDHRHAGGFGEAHQQVARIGVDDAAAGHDQRALGRVQHRDAPSRSARAWRRACRARAAA